MANLDDINIFLPKDSEGKTPLLFNPDAIRQKQLERQEIQDQLKKELSGGDIEQAYETFTELPILDQATTYLFPPTGVPIETYEFQKFGREAKPRLKSLKEFGLDLLNPSKRMPGSLLPSPIAVEDPLAATYSGLAGLGALGGAFDLFTLPKMAIAPILRKQMKDQKDKGIGGIPSTADEQILMYAKDPDTGYVSPTIQSLIKNAPKNLKGKQITEWLAGNTNKGVKPQEVEALGIAKFLEDNPDATTRQVIENASENKVRVVQTEYVQGGGRPVVEFEVSTPDRDPLDNSLLYEPIMKDIKFDLKNMTPADEPTAAMLVSTFKEANPGNPAKNLDEVKTFLESQGESLDDLIELQAKQIYQEDPYKLLEPLMPLDTDNYEKLPGFAFGNDEVGYQLFVNGERVTDKNNIAYSEMEAQLQLANKLESELGTDPLTVQGADDFYFDDEMGGAKYKNIVDESLPGGENYRNIVFSYENAPDFHVATDHFPEDTSIAHALVRDRKLDDGSLSLHVDELQSDIHTAGSKYGYKSPELVNELDNEYTKFYDQYMEKYLPFEKKMRQELLDMSARYPNDDGPKILLTRFDKIDKKMKLAGDPSNVVFNPHQNLVELVYNNNLDQTFPIVTKFFDDVVDDTSTNIVLNINNNRSVKSKLVPNYPYKKDWYVMSLKQLIRNAIEEGKDTISVSTSAPILARYTDKYEKFYKTLYDEKIPSAMKKLANKYGGKFEKGGLNKKDTFGEGFSELAQDLDNLTPLQKEAVDKDLPFLEANIIRITPEMKEKILTEGFESFGSGGSVDKPKSVLDDINIFTET